MTQTNAHLIYNLVNAKRKIRNAKADSVNPFHNSKYATLENVIEAVTTPLLEYGIVWQQIAHDCETGAKVETILMGHGGEIYCGPVYVPADKNSAHAFGSALTYARRYSLAIAVGIGADDDDGNDAQKNPPAEMSKQYTLWKSKDVKQIIFGTAEYCEALRSLLKDKSLPEATEICRENKSDITVALLDTKADESLTTKRKQNRTEYLEGWLANANIAQE